MFGMEKLKGTFEENYDLMLEKEIRIKLIVEEFDLLIEDWSIFRELYTLLQEILFLFDWIENTCEI